MRNRPLCSFCLVLLFLKLTVTVLFGARVEPALRTGPLKQAVKEDSNVAFKGQITTIECRETYQIIHIKEVSVLYRTTTISESKLIVYDSTFQNIRIGDSIEGNGQVRYFDKAHNPGNFDREFHYRKQGIEGGIWADCVTVKKQAVWQLPERIRQIRERMKQNLYQVMGKRDGAVLCAMLLGDRGDLDAELKEDYQKNGIGHILAISGLHISFLGIGFYKLLRKSGVSFAMSGAAGILFLTGYVYMTGFGISSVRALVMFLIRVGADISGRVYDMATALSVAAVAVILWRPLSFFDAGFLFSFGAIAGILMITPAIETAVPCRHKILKGLYAGAGINLMLFPFTLYFYFEFPPYSLLLNLIVIPLMSVMLGAGVSGAVVALVCPAAGGWILSVCSFIMKIYEILCQTAMNLPGARMVFGQPKPWQIVEYYLCLAGAVYILRMKKRKRRVAVLLIAGGLLLCTAGHGKKGMTDITVLDVGQGDGIFMRGPSGKTYFFDGGSSDVKHVGTYRIEPYLLSQGVSELEYVFLSHGDADHINGIEEMLERQEKGVRIRTIVLPAVWKQDEALRNLAETAKKNKTTVAVIHPGETVAERVSGKKLTIRCLQPKEDFKGEIGNASSMVLSVSFGTFDMLFTGDTEGAGEEELVLKEGLKQYEVLKVAHHGSKNSTYEAFLEKVRPDIAIISSGEENRYGHPHKDTLKRLSRAGARIVGTQENAAIFIQTDARTFRIGKYGK